MPTVKDPHQLFFAAKAISRAAAIVEGAATDAPSNDRELGASMLGSIVLRSFGLELLLKSIHARLDPNHSYKRGHCLKTLFQDIPDRSIQSRLKLDFYTATEQNLMEFLDLHSTAFEDWRYFLEARASLGFSVANANVLDRLLRRELETM